MAGTELVIWNTGTNFEIEVGNTTIKITGKQFAELTEQVFEYWRLTKEQAFAASTVADPAAHFNGLLGVEAEEPEQEPAYCSKCEGKTYHLSDSNLCEWCFDDAEKADRA